MFLVDWVGWVAGSDMKGLFTQGSCFRSHLQELLGPPVFHVRARSGLRYALCYGPLYCFHYVVKNRLEFLRGAGVVQSQSVHPLLEFLSKFWPVCGPKVVAGGWECVHNVQINCCYNRIVVCSGGTLFECVTRYDVVR